MADPFTAIGAVAAGLQLLGLAAKGLLKSIKLIKELHEIPQKISAEAENAFKSTERVKSICSHLSPSSATFQRLAPSQLARLSDIATELREAMEDLNATLQPLADRMKPRFSHRTTRLWSRLVSTKSTKDIDIKMERIHRLNTETIQELAFVELEIQLATKYDYTQ